MDGPVSSALGQRNWASAIGPEQLAQSTRPEHWGKTVFIKEAASSSGLAECR